MVIIETKSKTARIRDSSGQRSGGGGGNAGQRFETTGGKLGYAAGDVEIKDAQGNIVYSSKGGGSAPVQPITAPAPNVSNPLKPTTNPQPTSQVIKYGDIVVTKTPISPGVARQLAGADLTKPYERPQGFSLREDTEYSTTTRNADTPSQKQSQDFDVIGTLNRTSTKPKGDVQPVPQKKNISDKLEQKARELSFESQFRSESGSFEKISKGSAAFGLNFLAQGSRLFTQPVQTVVIKPYQFLKSLVTNPKQTISTTGYQIGQELKQEPGLFVSGVAGQVASFKAVPPLIKQAQQVQFVGKEEIAASSIVEPKILSGEQRFPSSAKSAPALLDEFKTSPFQDVIKEKTGVLSGGFSASPSGIITIGGVQRGTSATPGLYIAPSLSKYFLKLSSESAAETKFTLLPKVGLPTANFIETEVSLIPKGLVKEAEAVSGLKIGVGGQKALAGQPVATATQYTPQGVAALKKLNEYFGTKQGSIYGTGKSAISPEYYLGKGEKEALVGFGSGLQIQRQGNFWDKITGFRYYTTIEGQKVPIKIIQAQNLEGSGIIPQVVAKTENLLASRALRSSYESQRPTVSLLGQASRYGGVASRYNPQPLTSSRIAFPSSSQTLTSPFGSTQPLANPRMFSPLRSGSSTFPLLPSSSLTSRPVERIRTAPGDLIRSFSTPKTNYIPSIFTTNRTPLPPYRPPFSVKRGDKGGNFDVEFRRFGKFRAVGRSLSEDEANELGKRLAKTTLGASYRILEGGRVVTPNIDNRQFYLKNNIAIERSSYRLNKIGELREIGFFRKRKGVSL